ELNPVTAGMVAAPADYPWSSYRQKIGLEAPHVDFDPLYLGLGRSESMRREIWRDFVLGTLTEGSGRLIRDAVQRGQLTGGEQFVEEIARRIDRRI
ncbi:MAG: transposase, partial [Desulfuromonadales bacterium]|nr:transposase [Desulfuromonadales bacterium]